MLDSSWVVFYDELANISLSGLDFLLFSLHW
jgi:hypothetical protein